MENAGRAPPSASAPASAPATASPSPAAPATTAATAPSSPATSIPGAIAVRVVWFASPDSLRGDAATQHSILSKSGIDQTSITDPAADLDALWRGSAWLVDALLGTGLTRPVEGLLKLAIESINRSGRPVLSLDLPSGLDADSGVPLGLSVRATFTVTFVAPKLGFSERGASDYTGAVEVVEIGVPGRILNPFRG